MLLPEGFASLETLAEKWCVADDVDRSTVMDNASADELQTLIDTVSPQFEAINAHLDTKNDDDPEWNLGTLAEAACEARFELDRRNA